MTEDNAYTHVGKHARTDAPGSVLIIFTRYPTPGATKTRLIPALGADGAADLQRQMTEHTLSSLQALGSEGVTFEIRYEDGDEQAMVKWLGSDLIYVPQGDGDLGSKMRRAFEDAFSRGAGKVVIVGTDCPSLNADDVFEAFDLLNENTLTLGPAADGGYYLIALRSDVPRWVYDLVFPDIPWGTDQVFNATMNALAETGLDVGLLDEKADVDEPEDLIHWKREIRSQESGVGSLEASDLSISVIIPTYNEGQNISQTLDQLSAPDLEIVVADAGSTDATIEICERAGARVLRTAPGRAVQMNEGAGAASGNVFLFLHADTRLPDGFEDRIKGVILDGAVGGAFLFGTDRDTASMNIIENMAHFRTYRTGMVYGDQAIFATREAFYRAGTYPDQPIMEDYELWKKLKMVGKRAIIPLAVTTSARKWQRYGTWRLVLIHLAVMCMYLLGAGPERLARWYKKKLQKGSRE
ncbi:MAG: TIGR04283 family arsenosugar biosynthesis glycosyltransferase [Pseudomonadota bacterium]|jgi:hypothetical protein